ncbi:putative ribonuclease H-like domain-containing protein, partial [Tanacetum coccineum]
IILDEEVALRLQAELEEEERLAREKEEEANIALIESWDNTQAMIDADYQLAKQLQAQEQEELTIEEKSKLFVQLLEARKKHFAALRAEEKRNKPPTKAQKRNTMSTYLKNMAGYKHNQLKNKSFDDIQKLFDKAMKRVNTFVDMDIELMEGSAVSAKGSSKRAGEDLQQESTKKQKMDDVEETAEVDEDKEIVELQSLMEVIPDEEEVAVDAIPLAMKPPSIVDWKILKEGKISYFQIIRADGSSKRPEEGYERVIWGDLKTLFEPNIEDTVWRNLQGNKVLIWKLFDSCGVHFLRTSLSKGDKRANNNGCSDLSIIYWGYWQPYFTNTLLYEMVAGRYPSVKGAKVVVDTNTGCLNSYGFVRFADDIERIRAMNEMMVSIVQAGLCISVLQLLRSHLLNNSMDKINFLLKAISRCVEAQGMESNLMVVGSFDVKQNCSVITGQGLKTIDSELSLIGLSWNIEYLWFTWVFFLSTKDETSGILKSFITDPKSSQDDGSKPSSDDGKKVDEDPRKESECKDQKKENNVNTNTVNVVGTNKVNAVGGKTSIELPFDPDMPALEDDSIFDFSRDDDVGAEADINNLDTTIQVSPIPTIRIHKDHPLDQVIGDLQSATQIRKMSKNLKEHGFVSIIQQRTNHKDLQNCLFACILSQEEPKKVIHALKDPSWIEAMQEIQITRSLDINERIEYDEVFAPVARIEAIRLFLAYALFKDFVVYQMDGKSDFLYGKIEEEVYVCQPPGFEDPDFPDRVYRLKKHCMDYIKLLELGKAKKSVKLMMAKLFRMELKLMLRGQNYQWGTTVTCPSGWKKDKQLDGMSTHNGIYIAPSHTKKIFGNMRRVGKSFSGRVTPLFQTMVVQNQAELGEGSAIPTNPHHTPTFIQPSPQPQKTQKPSKPKRKDTQIPQPSDPSENVADEAVHKELGDSLVRAATTASSLEAEQDSGNITKTRSKATPNESSSLGTTSGGGPRCQKPWEILLLKLAKVESSSDEENLGEDASKQGRRIVDPT